MVSKQELTGRRGRRRGRRESDQAKVRIHDFCMDFGMLFVHKLLGYGLLGFSLEINLVPFSRVLLGIHPNSRFKGSLVQNP